MTGFDLRFLRAFAPILVLIILPLFSNHTRAQSAESGVRPVLRLGYPIRPWTTQNASIELREDVPFASSFLKQLRRQAVLLAARDELGFLTRDAFLDENAPAGSVEIKDADRFLVDGPGVVEGLFAQDVDYPGFLARLEKLSRDELVDALLPSGGSRIQRTEKTEIPAGEKREIEKRFYDYDVASQFDAVRRTHAAMKQYGETPELLRMLVRGYTQLQLLTNASFRDSHRVFQARAMLYAQRLVAQYGETPETVSSRAAAWSLNNFHRLARNDFASLPGDYKPDDWVRLARLYAEYDLAGLDALIESEKENPERKWAMLLKFVLLTYTNNGHKTAVPYARSVFEELTDCPRFYLDLFALEIHPLPPFPDGAQLHRQWASRIPAVLRKMDALPADVSKAVFEFRKVTDGQSSGGLIGRFLGGVRRPEERVPGGASVTDEPFYHELAALFQVMDDDVRAPDAEPSLGMLRTLLQDEIFFISTHYAYMSRFDEPDSVIKAAGPAIESHPLMNHLGLACRDAKLKEEFAGRFKKTQIPYEMLSAVRVGFDFPEENLWRRGKYMPPWLFAMRFGDRENVRDVFAYHRELRLKISRDTSVFTSEALARLCPENPLVAAERLARTQNPDLDEADSLLKKFGQYPNVREVASDYYLRKNERGRAIAVLREMQKAEPGIGYGDRIVRLYLEQGDTREAVAFLREIFENAEGRHSWQRTEAAAMLARILFLDGNDKEAAACFDLDNLDSSYRILPLKARFLEATGRFDVALRLYEKNLVDPFFYMDLHQNWAAFHRMDSDHCFEITDKLFEEYEKLRRQDETVDLSTKTRLYFVSYCMGLPMQDLFGGDPSVRVFFEHKEPIAGFLAFFEALEKGDPGKADSLLRLLQGRGSLLGRGELARVVGRANLPAGTGNPEIRKPVFRILATLLALDLQREKRGTIDPAAVETLLRIGTTDLLRNEDALLVLYFIGRYYVACGRRDEGLECFRRICSSRNLDVFWPLNLAVKELRDAGEKYSGSLRAEAKLPRIPADPAQSEEFSQRLSSQLRASEAARLTAVAETDTIFEISRSDLPVTDIFSGGRTGWSLPQGRLLRRLSGRSYYSAWSKDGKRVALGSEKYLAGIWDPESGDEFGGIRRTKNARGSAIAFTPDGMSVLFGGSDGTFGLWTPKLPGEAEPDWKKHEHPWTSCVAVSPDGQYACSATEDDRDRSVCIWEVRTGKLLHTMKNHEKGIHDAAFFDGGRRLITVSRDKTALIYNVATGRPFRSLQGHKDVIRTVSVSPDGRIIATGGMDDTVMLWDARTGDPIKTLGMFHGDVVSVAFSPDGTRMVVGRNHNGETIHILDTKTWKPVMSMPGHGLWNCLPCWSPDGRRLVTCGADTRLWDVSTDEDFSATNTESAPGDMLPGEMPLKDVPRLVRHVGSSRERDIGTYRSCRKEFPDSIWAHAPSRLVYRLDGKWKTFRTAFGIREGAFLSQASCIFIVLGDGRPLFRSELIADTLDRPLELDVRNVRTLELIVEHNRNNFNDHGVWFSPKLSR